jgi:mRNA-degrading endonuclease toxin of MazEF toxin-antitoxin module
MPELLKAQRGEIWFVKVPSDPPGKNLRPVVIVSTDARNRHERATTVLAVPLSTTLRGNVPTHIRLQPGETGLKETCEAQGENIATIRKESLQRPKTPPRRLSETKLQQIARCIVRALGFVPEQIR